MIFNRQVITTAVGHRMFLGMQDFDFAQILSKLPKLNPKPNLLLPNFALIISNFAPKSFAGCNIAAQRSYCSLPWTPLQIFSWFHQLYE